MPAEPPVRLSGTWMTIWDDRILEYINAKGHGAPTQLAETDYVRVSRQHVSRRLRELAAHGLVTELDNGVYVITDQGEEYLAGTFDAGEAPAAGETADADGD